MPLKAAVVVSLLALVGTGCELHQTRSGAQETHAQLSGSIVIPDNYRGAPNDFCEGLGIRATFLGIPVGHTEVIATDTQCLYTTERLPANTELSIHAAPETPLPCMKGELVSVAPSDYDLTLGRGEVRNLDFHALCGT